MDGKGQGTRQADGRGPRAGRFSLERLFGQLWRQPGVAREREGARVERRLRPGKGALSSSPFPRGLRPHLIEPQEVHEEEEVRGGRQDTAPVPALDPPSGLRQAPSPSVHKRGRGPSH